MTSTRSRDETIEALLRSTAEPDEAPPPTSCPDPDVLAAHYEGVLSASESATLSSHLAACGRCRAQLALLARSEPIPGPAASGVGWLARWRWIGPMAATVAAATILWVAVDPARQLDKPLGRTSDASPSGERTAPPEARRLEPDERAQQAGPSPDRDAQVVAERTTVVPERPVAAPVPTEEMEARYVVRTPELAAEAGPPSGVAPIPAEPLMVEVPSRSEPRVRWRFGAGGAIVQSRDDGGSWQAQDAGVSVDLLAGSAPSPAVCWAVGRGGVIIRTTDGSTWYRVAFPSGDDLVGIEATDERTAVVTTERGDRLRTEDTGLGWTPVR